MIMRQLYFSLHLKQNNSFTKTLYRCNFLLLGNGGGGSSLAGTLGGAGGGSEGGAADVENVEGREFGEN